MSHASPIKSPSASSWSAFGVTGQLSIALFTPSPSESKSASHASPVPSSSESAWFALDTVGQLSISPEMPSPSESLFGSFGNASHAFPFPSRSVSSWSALDTVGQLSSESAIPSPSESVVSQVLVLSIGHESSPSKMPSLSSSGSHALPIKSLSVSS